MRQATCKKMLVVEDCPSDVFLLERMLQEEDENSGVEIVSVPRLIDAFQRIDDELFDVILLDLNLLDIDGIASVAALTAETPGTPVIVYSGMADKKTMEKALLCGATSYLIKGRENAGSLLGAINAAVDHGRAA